MKTKITNRVRPDVIKTVSRGIESELMLKDNNSLFDRRNRYDTRTSELIYIHISRRLLLPECREERMALSVVGKAF